jgi:hypothetical protein
MQGDRISREVLKRATEIVGGEEALAKLLKKDIQDVHDWLQAKRQVPLNVYLEACRLLGDRREN